MTPRDCVCKRARHEHGTPACHIVCGCRCLLCRAAYANQVTDRRNGVTRRISPLVPVIGTRRRIEALHALGWSGQQLADRLETTFQNIHQLRTKDSPIYPTTAARVTALYDELWDQAPIGRHVVKTRRWATRNGFLPPLAWDDDAIDVPAGMHADMNAKDTDEIDPVAVSEAVKGRRVTLTRPELTAAVETMTAMGMSTKETADRLGITSRGVTRTRTSDKPIRAYRKAVA